MTSGAAFILAINTCVASLLAAAFLAISLYDSNRTAARWLAASYIVGGVYFVAEFSINVMPGNLAVEVVAFAVFLLATMLFNVGLARKYEVDAPLHGMAVFFLGATLLFAMAQSLERQSLIRLFANQLPYAGMQLTGMMIVLSSPRRQAWIDRLLAAVLCTSAVQFLAKPLVARLLDGPGSTPGDYLATTYALISQSTGTVVAVALALLTIMILVRDILSDAADRSENDALSGVLNRGGFERRAGAAVREALRQNMPVALVICDLDHFKAINDTFGHACGDKVIQTFAGFMREAAADHHIVGRIGGEEFAIILPGTNLVAARLFAEGARGAFATLSLDGLPREAHVTASFGVAELDPNETIDSLMKRADAALYEAKKNGRDCVKIAIGQRRGLRKGPVRAEV